ncbi:hypothetical protein ACRARG_20535 [Pseudooceanicola sp. C21-150M6]|uniref:hypothetical protein n=1 Tax=Pseudooceanicola sp. C21-150M6 TaxID=3434355 RepID=UPI003D7F5BD5
MLPQSFAETGIHIHRVNQAAPEMYQVLGERGSGTNVVRKLIDKNVRTFRTEALGWKHGFPHMIAVPDNLLTVVCIRDARNWALSMHDRPWHAHPEMHRLGFAEFIRTPWRGIVDRVTDFETIHPELKAQGADLQFDRHPLTGRPFDNLFALRRAKLEGHLSMLRRGGDVMVVRMESFLNDPESALQHLCRAFDLIRKHDDLKLVKRRMGTRHKIGSTRPETPSEMAPEDIAFMKTQLDLPLEAQLGYDY